MAKEYCRQNIVDLVNSWIGKCEKDGSHKEIIDIYNSLPTSELPRKTKMQYDWPWCACTWSALAIKLDYLDIMPIEISCAYLIQSAQEMGIWQEADDYIPEPGDAVLYDWDDSGSGDNKGNPDHIGTVVYVSEDAGYMVTTEGNYDDSVKQRTISLNGRYIRGFITPVYTDNNVTDPALEGGKSVSEVAHEVIAGQWGNGTARKEALTTAGYDYDTIQAEVNRILNGDAAIAENDQSIDSSQPTEKKVTATCYAKKFDSDIAGTYKTTSDLYCRNDAGTNKKALCWIPKDTSVKNYGYYSMSNGVKWLYIQFAMDGVQYTGFSSGAYLKKV